MKFNVKPMTLVSGGGLHLCRDAVVIFYPNLYRAAHSWELRVFIIFPRGINPKVKVVARLEFELSYFVAAVMHFNYHPLETPQKPQIENETGCEWRHARKRWAENLVILKKTLVEIWFWVGPVQLEGWLWVM